MRYFLFISATFLFCLTATNASAGKIFGDIRMDGKPVPEGLQVNLKTPAGEDSATTDKFGSYKVTAKDEGKSTLTLVYENQPVSLEVFSYKDATRYDLILEKKDGKLSLKRK